MNISAIQGVIPCPNPSPLQVAGHGISGQDPVFIIAELGTGHGGDSSKAFEMIHAAKESGADCIKLQIVFADEIIHPRTGEVPLPGGSVPLYEVFRRIERDLTFYQRLIYEITTLKLVPLATPFGKKSMQIVSELDIPAVKIASPELNHFPLLDLANTYSRPVFLSTGVSKLGDIEAALARLSTPTVLLHCLTAYPAPAVQYNLRILPSLRSIFGVWTGVSDHSLDPVLIPVAALLLGAVALEKHFTLDRKAGGLDDPIALTPRDFSTMCNAMRSAASQSAEQTLDDLIHEYGRETIEKVLGSGIKKLAPAEAENYTRTNRSIHAVVDIPAETELTSENISILRTEKILRPGISPAFYSRILGTKTRTLIPAGEGVTWSDLLSF